MCCGSFSKASARIRATTSLPMCAPTIGETAWLFCVARPDAEADSESVANTVAAELGKAFKPERVVWVSALPKTRSAKIVRRAVRAKAIGEDPGDLSSLENPEALEEIEANGRA